MAKQEFLAHLWNIERESILMDTQVMCQCGQMVTRRECECRLSYYDDVTFRNYYHRECGSFVRCDSQFTPLVKPVALDNEDVLD